MNQDLSFGTIVKERRKELGLTQTELARRVGCAPVTIRKIEYDTLRPSVQIAEHLAVALNIPEEEHMAFVRLARTEREPDPIPVPAPAREEIGQEDLTGRAYKGFELGERIGTGGYGAVYRAVQATIERDVAIKIILPKYADQPEFIRRFEAEAQLVAQLEHPHIVPLYDYWREPGVAYLVMRFLRGGSLDDRLRNGPLAVDTILPVLEQIGAGLHAAHRAGVIHRDIKPANILLDEDGNAYLADFGIAKNLAGANNGGQTTGEMVIGSPAYISPEQIMAEPVKPQTDVYSLGVMLYELLTGHKPFRGPTPVAYIQQHLGEQLPLLAAAQNGDADNGKQVIPTPMDIVIGRATAKEASERYPDILSMLADIRRAIGPDSSVADVSDSQMNIITPPHIAAMIDLPDLENPYKGLRPFDEADTADFFGRDTLIQALLIRMAEESDLSRFLAVVGPSGSGKSSVVKAGLMPALRQGGLPDSEKWFIVEMTPGPHPLEELEAALLRVAVNPPDSLLAQLREDERGLLRAVNRILPADHETELVLVIDQFEEIFTLVEDGELRTHLLDSLVTAVLDTRSRVRIIITMRADFTDRPLQYVDFGELVRQQAEFVLPLTPDELELAITGPTKRAGLSLEAGLVPTIIGDIGDQPGMLPLLQYALTELFERREGRKLTLTAYQESGGVLGALARRAEELYHDLDEAGQEAARQLFLRLVTLGEGTEDTRRRVLRSEVARIVPSPDPSQREGDLGSPLVGGIEGGQTLDTVIDQFGRYRLLTFDHDPVTRGPTIEVAHEALLREWSQLRGWLEESRSDIRLQRLLAAAAEEWLGADRDSGYLLRGSRLNQFEGWAANTDLALTYDERSFLRTSLAARRARKSDEESRQRRELETAKKLAETQARRAEEQTQAARRFRWLAVGLAVFLLVAISAAWFAYSERNSALNNFVRAERIRLAAQAQIALDNGEGGDLPALLALGSLQHGYSPEADAALLSALRRGFTQQQFIGHTDEVRRVDFSPDGRYVLTAGADSTARLWDAQTGQEVRQFTGHSEFLNMTTFSPDGRYVLTTSHDNSARLWDTQTGQELQRFVGHTAGVGAGVFSPDGQYVATGSIDGTARLWDAQTGQELRQFIGHTDTIPGIDFSPDGRFIATASNDQTARLWDVETGQELRQFTGHTDCVCGISFSPDGRQLLTVSHDHTARLWDIQTGWEVRRFVGHTDLMFEGTFSPDGQYVLTSSYDKTARLWDIASGLEVHQFIGHTGGLGAATFSPDGQYIVTGSLDQTARLWQVWSETEPRVLDTSISIKKASGSERVSLSPDGRYMLTGSAAQGSESVARLWDIQTGELEREINLDISTIEEQILSPDGRYILTGSGDGIARLWEAQTGEKVRQFAGHVGPILDVAFSTDGRYVLTGSEDKTARLWETETGQEVQQFIGHTDRVGQVVFSPDGGYVLTGSDDKTAKLWDLRQTGQELREFAGHNGPVRDVAFSSDGRYVLTGSDDGTAQLWDLQETGQAVRQFIGHTAQVGRVAFSPDGRYVLTGSSDQTARLWDAQTGQEVRRFVGHASPVLSVGFSADGRYVFTADVLSAFLWRTTLDDVVEFACTQLSRDFTDEEQALYNITDNTSTCPEFTDRTTTVEPTWTPVPRATIPASTLTLATQPSTEPSQVASETMELVMMTDIALIQAGIPMQDIYIEAGDGLVMRPQEVNAETLAEPLYRATTPVEKDFLELPYDVGPYEKGEPLGLTLEEWLAATGHGTYAVQGNQAILDLTFENLIPNGLYTLWCTEINIPPNVKIIDRPCGAPDGSENVIFADENGNGAIKLEMDALPPTTDETIYAVALAYHSDGRTYGELPGDFGSITHVHLAYEFPPPADTNNITIPTSTQTSAVPGQPASETMELVMMTDIALIQAGIPMQDIYIEAGDGLVMRPQEVNAETLAEPLYRATTPVEKDFLELPYDVGPYEKGEPLGLTLEEWLAATGHGTYAVQGNQATLDLTFENLIPNGLYTLWCTEINIPPNVKIIDRPCGAPDGSENVVIVNEDGSGEIMLEMDALPPTTDETIYAVALAYHSDGHTYGELPGDFGSITHVHLAYEFPPPAVE